MNIGIIGAGSFGTALAVTLVNKGHQVMMWGRDERQMVDMAFILENSKYLPGVELPKTLKTTADMEKAVSGRDILVFAVPAQSFRGVLTEAKKYMTGKEIVVNVAKGIEKESLMRLSEVAKEVFPEIRYAVLSGPSHAEEVARFLPTTVACAAFDENDALTVQKEFSTDRFRVYTNQDIIGVELGGAIKNIIALGAGISEGLGFGDNAKAALITRGITEIKRLGTALGADPETFAGLTGIGDLVVTCMSVHSRNRKCGKMLGEGYKLEIAKKKVGMVVEGVDTCEAAYELAKKHGIEMPITNVIHSILTGETEASEAVQLLMGRSHKGE